ncbi:MAG: c-type cytochrome, partial [Gammaproteobacteria bacterium]
WRQRWPEKCYSGSVATAGNLVFTGMSDGRFMALDSRDGKSLWAFQTGAGVNAPPSVFEHKGEQYIAVYTAGNLFAKSPPGDSVWLFSLTGTLESVTPPLETDPADVSLEGADIAAGADLYARTCAACHGNEGKGGHGGGPSIERAMEPSYIVSIVTNGGGNMPPFGARLKAEQVRDVVMYVRSRLQSEAP